MANIIYELLNKLGQEGIIFWEWMLDWEWMSDVWEWMLDVLDITSQDSLLGHQEGIIIWVGVLLFVLFILGLLFGKLRQATPALMTSIGILGTFCGIFIALYPLAFDNKEVMDQSIQALLNGMKIAFVTSLLGIGSAIIFRVVIILMSILTSILVPAFLWIWKILRLPQLPPKILRQIARMKPQVSQEQREVQDQRKVLEHLDAIKQAISGDGDSSMVTQIQKMRHENRDELQKLQEESREGFQQLQGLSETIREALVKNIGEALQQLIQNIEQEQRKVLEHLDAIKQAISGDGDSSMVTQIQKMRHENREGFQQLQGLSETIHEALVENLGAALQNLIKNIEEALINQFGKTFAEFNEATQALKQWQEDHRKQVEQLTKAFGLAEKGITRIAEECKTIPPTMDQLRETVEIAHHDVESLNRQVEAFAAMRQQAEESFPLIKQHLDAIGADLAASAQSFNGLEETIRSVFLNIEKESQRVAREHAESMKEMSDNMREAFSTVESDTRKITERHSENVQQIVDSMATTLQDAQNESAKEITRVVEGAINQFSEEMNRVAHEWGENLVAVAKRAQEAIEKVEDA